MALDQQLDAIVQEHADNELMADITPDGRRALREYARRAAAATQTEPPGGAPDSALAAQSMRRVLAEAERVAEASGSRAIDERAVQAAFLNLCPGLYPWC
jgi:hypothetical protein